MTEKVEHLSRRMRSSQGKRRRQPDKALKKSDADVNPINTEFKQGLIKTRFLPALVWSLILSLFSVANPYLISLASNLQTQNLYAGFAMQSGQVPYGDFFATDGVLFYLLTYLGSSCGTTLVFAVLQFIALTIAGIHFDKIVGYFSKSREMTDQLTVWFYLFILALDFGGIYASLYALPFLLSSIWFLIRYFEESLRDEAFLLYGLDAAVVFLIAPKSVVLWIIATLVLFIYNMRRKRLARGFYQFLTALFGFLLVLYSVGYYTFVKQILGDAINQTFIYNLSLDFTYSSILWTILIVCGVLLVSGFLHQLVATLGSLGRYKHRYIKVVVLLAFLAQLVFIVGMENFDISQLIILLPYGFVMAVIHLQPEGESDIVGEGDEEVRTEPVFYDYLRKAWFLPILACIYIPLQPILLYVQEGTANQERAEIATYIAENSEESDLIYAWDDSALLYLESGRLSAATVMTAEPYLNTKANQTDVAYDLNQLKATYIVVNEEVDMLDAVQATLDSQYSAVDLGTDQFTLYKKN